MDTINHQNDENQTSESMFNFSYDMNKKILTLSYKGQIYQAHKTKGIGIDFQKIDSFLKSRSFQLIETTPQNIKIKVLFLNIIFQSIQHSVIQQSDKTIEQLNKQIKKEIELRKKLQKIVQKLKEQVKLTNSELGRAAEKLQNYEKQNQNLKKDLDKTKYKNDWLLQMHKLDQAKIKLLSGSVDQLSRISNPKPSPKVQKRPPNVKNYLQKPLNKNQAINISSKDGFDIDKIQQSILKFYQDPSLPEQKILKAQLIDQSNHQFNGQLTGQILSWSRVQSGDSIRIGKNGKSAFLQENNYVFRSVLSSFGFISGFHYWEIILDPRTINQIKIGVSSSSKFNFDSSFSDYDFGWAFYCTGQLRHANNSQGKNYGQKIINKGTVGVFLHIQKGILAFSINGKSYGVAFSSQKLKKGPLYPAISLLHIGGCIIKGELEVPSCFYKLL